MAYRITVKGPAYPAHDRPIYASDIRRLFADHMPDATVLEVAMEDVNGWKNRETWQADLWIRNDGWLSRVATGTLDDDYGPPGAEQLRTTVEDYLSDFYALENGGLLGDIIGLWLDRVDWEELSEAYRDDCSSATRTTA